MTYTQIQHLLAYLGYYTIKVDGLWGDKSREACTAFQRAFGLTADGVPGPDTQKALRHSVAYGMPEQESAPRDFWASVPNFAQAEFACKCGCGFDDIDQGLATVCQRLRDHFGAPMIISSGCRCPAHNGNVGGVPTSRHLLGHAVDFAVRGHKSAEVLAQAQKQPEIVYAYAIDEDYVHMDIGG